MKRFLLVIPVILFVFLIACNNNPGVPPEWSTAVVQTLTATVVTPTISPTPMYVREKAIISRDLNAAIEVAEVLSGFERLEHSIGASYQVSKVDFSPDNNIAAVLRISVTCQCASDNNCCTVEQAFLTTMAAMYSYQSEIIETVPTTVSKLNVMCLYHDRSCGSINVSWYAVKNFLYDPTSNCYLLASEVTHEP